jgi:ABC-2 type transport system permease protein
MHEIGTLLRPRLLSMRNAVRSSGTGGALRLFLFGGVGVLFWGGIFAISLRVLRYFRGVEEIGHILSLKLLSMMIISSFALLIFSSLLTALSKLYLSRDLYLVHATPVPAATVLTARWIDSTVDSSWMVIVFTLPVFLAYGLVYQGGLPFYGLALLNLLILAVIASLLSTILVQVFVILIPANRMRSIFLLLGILFFVVLYLAIRLLKPETMVDPEVFETVMLYVASLETPQSPWLPSTWFYQSIRHLLDGNAVESLYFTALAASFAGALFFLMVLVADGFYFKGFSKTQTAAVRLIRSRGWRYRWLGFLSPEVRTMVVKELKTFFRDQTQWSQLFLIAALIVIYVYNFKVLPLDRSPIKTIYLQNLFSFLNVGLALFVLTAIAGRFAYPAISIEKEAIWIVKSSPLSLKAFLWIKFFIYFLPLLVLSEILIVTTNLLLNVSTFMMVLSITTVLVTVPGIVALGIGMGAAYPDFKAENPSQTVTGYGGLLFMMLSAGFIGIVLVLQAGPVYHIFMAGLRDRPLSPMLLAWTTIAFASALAMSAATLFLPMRYGERRLEANTKI